MVVGVLGEVVVHLVVLEYRQEHAQILLQQMVDLSALDLQVKPAILRLAPVNNLYLRQL